MPVHTLQLCVMDRPGDRLTVGRSLLKSRKSATEKSLSFLGQEECKKKMHLNFTFTGLDERESATWTQIAKIVSGLKGKR